MIKNIFFILFFLMIFTLKAGASCDDKPGDGVDYSGCQFADGQDLPRYELDELSRILTRS